MAGFTALLTGASALASAGGAFSSFKDASKQRDLQLQAEAEASKAMAEARKRLEVNFYKGLSIQKEPYELEREALIAAGAQSMEAARESDVRGVGATAGRVQLAQNEGQRNIAMGMGKELTDLERLTATEEGRLRDENVKFDLQEVEGAQMAAANANQNANIATQQGWAGVTSAVGQLAKLPALYDKTASTKMTESIFKEGAKKGLTPEQIQWRISDLANQDPSKFGAFKGSVYHPTGVDDKGKPLSGFMNGTQFNDYLIQQNPDLLKQVYSSINWEQ